MQLPSGNEISREKLVEMCETVIRDKFMWECSYEEAFETTEDTLSEGQYEGVPALDADDLGLIYDTLKDVVIDCEIALRKTLDTFLADNAVVKSW